ncbi:gamma-glutamyltransferase [Porticoccaceae bacterium]|nr:gamma-glutamyltransferase [Porticoccaceae bacterium]
MIKSLFNAVSISFFLVLSSFSLASEKAIIDPSARFHPLVSDRGMVVSQEMIASQVGADILARGGNAVDAAVATGFALAVTLPRAGNLGGGGFMLVHLAAENKTVAIDYREMAPASASRDMFLDAEGDVDNKKARYSMQSSGVPGTVAGLLHALDSYGTMSLKQVLQPAIELAANGFKVSMDLSSSLQARQETMHKNPASREYFYKADGAGYEYGETLIQKHLAATLQRIAKKGRSGFYQGKTAQLIVAEMQRSGGLISHKDLTGYRVIERTPVCGDYRGNSVCAMPPPSSGGVHMLQMLNILEGWDLASLGHNSAAYIHRLVESMRRAYADRSSYLGDPDYFPVPVAELTDKQYATELREQINLVKSSRSADIRPGLDNRSAGKESTETTHFSTWDRWGNVVSNTYTLNFSYGSGISVTGAGFLLNNEMDDFSAKPGSPNGYGLVGGIANAIEPGKRPLSSMTPTIVFDKSGAPILATGSPGGSTIITIVMQMLLNIIDFDMNVAEATAAPRIHHQWLPDRVFYEAGVSADTLQVLREMGHQLNDKTSRLGATQSIQADSDGTMIYGTADYRREGSGVAIPIK